MGKSNEEVDAEVASGRFPPCILYKIIYTGPEEMRVNTALMKVDLHGADVPITFSCRVKAEKEMSYSMYIICIHVYRSMV